MTLLAEFALRSAVVLLAGLVMSALLARRSAALRHFVLTIAIFTSAAVAPLHLAIPEWTVPVNVAMPRVEQPPVTVITASTSPAARTRGG